jgi:hypothetical protein
MLQSLQDGTFARWPLPTGLLLAPSDTSGRLSAPTILRIGDRRRGPRYLCIVGYSDEDLLCRYKTNPTPQVSA